MTVFDEFHSNSSSSQALKYSINIQGVIQVCGPTSKSHYLANMKRNTSFQFESRVFEVFDLTKSEENQL